MKNNKQLLLELLSDVDDYAQYKQIDCPAIYLLGGSACILGDYVDRATLDIDFIDLSYDASKGKLFRLFGRFDMLDFYTTTLSEDYQTRAQKLPGYNKLDFYILSPEDIIVSKLARYSAVDREDIAQLMDYSNRDLIKLLIGKVLARQNMSEKVREAFVEHSRLFAEQYNV